MVIYQFYNLKKTNLNPISLGSMEMVYIYFCIIKGEEVLLV